MNKGQIITVAVTVVVTLMLTGVLKWFFAIFDAVIPFSKAPEKIKSALSIKSVRELLVWVFLFSLNVVLATAFVLFEKGPITRLTILYGAYLTGAVFFSAAILFWQLLSFSSERRMAKRLQREDEFRAQ